MKFIILKKELIKGLNSVSKAVSSRNPIQVLTGIKFELSEDGLTLIGSDTDISIKYFIPQKNKENQIITFFEKGIFILNSRFITEISKKISGEKIEFEKVDGNLIKVSDKKTNINLNSMDTENYPYIEFKENKDVFTLNGKTFKNIISQTIFATSLKETRPVLTGINFGIDSNSLKAVATDTFRLAKKEMTVEYNGFYNVTIPARSLSEIYKIILDEKEVEISIYEKKVIFKTSNTIINTRIITGSYPDTQKLVPSSFSYILKAKSNELVEAIDRASLLTSDKNNIVKLKMNKDKIEVISKNQEIGSVVEKISNFSYEGEPLTISFSAEYAIEAIKAIEKENVELKFQGEMKPFVIKGEKEETLTQLVLPVRTFN